MKKIAVACEGNKVTEHFGHCEHFRIYDTKNSQILAVQTVANPGHKPGFLPNFLSTLGVNVIISGGMGGGAQDIFNQLGIEIVTGASGNDNQVVSKYLDGSLVSSNTVCKEHSHEENCQ